MLESLNVLVVDDDSAILEMFQDFSRIKKGFTILPAHDGDEALNVCEHKKIDFCFTDLYMPGMGGMELVRRIQNLDNTIPIVVMTGFPTTEGVINTLKTGVVDFLVKPFKVEGIEVTIRKAQEKRDLFVENLFLKEEIRRGEQLALFNAELSEKVHDLNVLNTVLQKIDYGKTSSTLYDHIVKLCSYVTGSDECYFHVLDEPLDKLILIASFRRDGKKIEEKTMSYVEDNLRARISEGIPFLLKNKDGLNEDIPVRSIISMPLKIREKIFGILTASLMGGGARSFTEKELYYLDFMGRRTAVVVENLALYENIYDNLFSTLYAFVEAIEARDPYTKQHSSRVANVSRIIGQEIGCSPEQLDLLHFSGHLHDVGKIGIRDSILLKPGRLTKEEFEIIKQHPVIGESIVSHLGLMSREQKVIRHHHERWDGSGYPDGLKGEEIPFLSRILAVADVYDAMASDRAYRTKLPTKKIFATIVKNAGTQFDAAVVEGFIQVYNTGAFENGRCTEKLACQDNRVFENKMLQRFRLNA